MDSCNKQRYLKSLIDEPAFSKDPNGEMRLPDLSPLLVPLVLNALGGAIWAGKFVVALPSSEELFSDGAPENWSLKLLAAEVRAAVWGQHRAVSLYKKDISTRQGGFVYFSPEFQDRLCSSLESGPGPGYAGAQAWMLARFNRACRAQVCCCCCAVLVSTKVVDFALLYISVESD